MFEQRDPLRPASTASETSAWSKTTPTPYETESWAVSTGLSKTGNFAFPLLLLASARNAQLLRTCNNAVTQITANLRPLFTT